jgi:YfiH family protein
MESALTFWKSPNLAFTGIQHGFTERKGGISEPPFDSLNLGLHVGDNLTHVIENRRRGAESLGFRLDDMVCAEQVHGKTVAVVTAHECGRGATTLATAIPATDALVTNTPGVLLALFFADCLPVFFVDRERPAVGIAHAGWRGLVNGVLEETVSAMSRSFGSRAERLHVAIGPGICVTHFEVGTEVAAAFPEEVVHANKDSGKPHIDLLEAARQRLMQAGISPADIDVAGDCTFTLPARFFSHRRDQGRTGRMGALIGIAK